MVEKGKGTEVLTFIKGNNLAYVVTDGVHHMLAMNGHKDRFFPKLHKAIASLETRGFQIIVDVFESYPERRRTQEYKQRKPTSMFEQNQ